MMMFLLVGPVAYFRGAAPLPAAGRPAVATLRIRCEAPAPDDAQAPVQADIDVSEAAAATKEILEEEMEKQRMEPAADALSSYLAGDRRTEYNSAVRLWQEAAKARHEAAVARMTVEGRATRQLTNAAELAATARAAARHAFEKAMRKADDDLAEVQAKAKMEMEGKVQAWTQAEAKADKAIAEAEERIAKVLEVVGAEEEAAAVAWAAAQEAAASQQAELVRLKRVQEDAVAKVAAGKRERERLEDALKQASEDAEAAAVQFQAEKMELKDEVKLQTAKAEKAKAVAQKALEDM